MIGCRGRMWRVVIAIALSAMALGTVALGEGAGPSDFALDERLMNSMYDSAISTARATESSRVVIEVGYSRLVPEAFVTSNDYFTVDHRANVSTLDMGVAVARWSLIKGRYAEAGGLARLAFGYNQGIYAVRSALGVDLRDELSVQTLDVGGGADAQMVNVLPWWLTLGARVTGGMVWVYQTGNLDGMTQGYWIPVVAGGPTMTLFGDRSPGARGFVGVTLAADVRRSMGATQRLSGWNGDLGVRYAF